MRIFDYSFLENYKLDNRLIEHINSIRIEPNVEEINSTIMTSVLASSWIEGIKVDNDSFDEVCLGRKIGSHSENAVLGLRDLVLWFYTDYNKLKISTELFITCIKVLNKYTKDYGGFKRVNNIIEKVNTLTNKREIQFKPLDYRYTEKALEQVVHAFNKAWVNPKINNLYLIPCMILDFLCIHPYEDGNGRISRALTELLYLKLGIKGVRAASFSNHVLIRRFSYYSALAHADRDWITGKNDYKPFITETLIELNETIREVELRQDITSTVYIKSAKDRLENYLYSNKGNYTVSELSNRFNISTSTVRDHLHKLYVANKVLRFKFPGERAERWRWRF